MRAPDQQRFNFGEAEVLPRRHTWFLALFPDASAARRVHSFADGLCEEEGIRKRLAAERFHISLACIRDGKRIRSKDRFLAEFAARAVRLPAFEITFTRVGSFRGYPKKGRPLEHPLVLLADSGTVNDLYRVLANALKRQGVRIDDEFRPHLTLAYHTKMLPWQSIEPIRFRVCEFVLVNSFVGLTHYEIEGRWPLGPLLLPPPPVAPIDQPPVEAVSGVRSPAVLSM